MMYIVCVLPGNMFWNPWSAVAILMGSLEATIMCFEITMIWLFADSIVVRQ